ncbi:MAG: DUF2336 domain-containing protein [Alphaproteobacteria bacterium]|nr:DUF2336 domain-containing protein [Alphaproteobacteria bacterium]
MTNGHLAVPTATARDLVQRGRAHAEAMRRHRARIAEALNAPSGEVSDGLSDRDRSQMISMLRRLADEVQGAIVRHLDRTQAERPSLARAVGRGLAGDEPGDPYGRLLDSGMLRDFELIEQVEQRRIEDRLERALKRHELGEPRDAAAGSHADALFAILQAAGPAVVEGLNAYLVRRARRVDTYDNPTIDAADLDPALVRRLYWGLAATLRRAMLADRSVDETDIDNALEAAVVEALAAQAERAGPDAGCRRFIEATAAAGLLSPDLVVGLLRAGEVPLFVAALARLGGLRVGLVRRLVFEPGGEGLAALARSVGLSLGHFSVIARLTRLARYATLNGAREELAAAERVFAQLGTGEAARVLAYWRRNPGYLEALWRSEPRLGQPCSA